MSHHTSGMPFRYAIVRLDMVQLPGIGWYVDTRLVSLGTAAHKETARSRPSSCRTNWYVMSCSAMIGCPVTFSSDEILLHSRFFRLRIRAQYTLAFRFPGIVTASVLKTLFFPRGPHLPTRGGMCDRAFRRPVNLAGITWYHWSVQAVMVQFKGVQINFLRSLV